LIPLTRLTQLTAIPLYKYNISSNDYLWKNKTIYYIHCQLVKYWHHSVNGVTLRCTKAITLNGFNYIWKINTINLFLILCLLFLRLLPHLKYTYSSFLWIAYFYFFQVSEVKTKSAALHVQETFVGSAVVTASKSTSSFISSLHLMLSQIILLFG
jgi:hypothetical protein